MDALTVLNEHIDYDKLLEHYDFDKIHSEGSYTRACCKLHQGNNPTAFVVNTRNNLWFCHTGDCGGGDAYTLVQKMEGVTFPEAVTRVAHILGVNITGMRIAERKSEFITEMKRWIRMMRNKVAVKQQQPFSPDAEVRKVNKYRSFKPETLEKFGCGYVESFECSTEEGRIYTLNKRIYVPIHNEHGVQVGASLRATVTGEYPKWSHQPRELKAGDMLYNFDRVKSESKITVVEGMYDVWAYDEIDIPAVCTFGAHISEKQYELLIKSGADLVASFDGDDAGRNAMKKFKTLFTNKANVEYVVFKEGHDPENITRSELLEYYNNRVRRF